MWQEVLYVLKFRCISVLINRDTVYRITYIYFKLLQQITQERRWNLNTIYHSLLSIMCSNPVFVLYTSKNSRIYLERTYRYRVMVGCKARPPSLRKKVNYKPQ